MSAGITGLGRFDSLASGMIDLLTGKGLSGAAMAGVFGGVANPNPIMTLFLIIMMSYAVIKVFFSSLKRGGILLIQISVGSLYMFSVPRGQIKKYRNSLPLQHCLKTLKM